MTPTSCLSQHPPGRSPASASRHPAPTAALRLLSLLETLVAAGADLRTAEPGCDPVALPFAEAPVTQGWGWVVTSCRKPQKPLAVPRPGHIVASHNPRLSCLHSAAGSVPAGCPTGHCGLVRLVLKDKREMSPRRNRLSHMALASPHPPLPTAGGWEGSVVTPIQCWPPSAPREGQPGPHAQASRRDGR